MTSKRLPGSVVFDIINTMALVLFTLLCLFPFYYMLIYSLSTPTEASRNIMLLPRGLTLQNYIRVAQISAIPQAALVSVLRTIVGAAVTLICCSFFAYLVSKPLMYGRKLIYRLLVITMYVNGGLIPTYLVMRFYGLRNNFLIYILPTALNAYYVILIKTFMEQLPASMEEAAVLDGAGIFTCWFRVVMPLSLPILATITVFAMVGQWNAWFDALIYITRSELYPLQYILYKYLQEAQYLANQLDSPSDVVDVFRPTPDSVRMTITAVITLPILLVYPFMQQYFAKGILLGAVKG